MNSQCIAKNLYYTEIYFVLNKKIIIIINMCYMRCRKIVIF